MWEIKFVMLEIGVKFFDIELVCIYEGVDLKCYLFVMEVVVEFGGCYVFSSIWMDDCNFGIECFVEFCDLVKFFGLIIELEFVFIGSVYNFKGVMDVFYMVNCENVGFMIDIYYFYWLGDKVEDLDDVFCEWFCYFYFCNVFVEILSLKEEMIWVFREEWLYLNEEGIDVVSIINCIL